MDKKYQTLLDEETWAFVDLTQTFYPANSEELSVTEQRQCYENMCRHFFAGYPQGVTSSDDDIQTPDGPLAIRCYQLAGSSAPAQLVYYHGGGYVLGNLDSHDDVCAEICARTGFPVTSVDYRLAPENIYPADFNDALAGFEYTASTSDLPVIVAGDSAGGNLAAAVCHATRNTENQPVGQVLIYPALASDMTGGTFIEHANAPLLSIKETKFYKAVRCGGNEELLQEPTCSPLNDTDFSNLPPTIIISAQCDPLSGDGSAYADKITATGGKAICHTEKGLIHGYLRARHSVERARESFTKIVGAIDALGHGRWPGYQKSNK